MSEAVVHETSSGEPSWRTRYAPGIFTGAIVLLWLVVLWPAYRLGGVTGIEGATWAAGLSLLPGWLVFAAGAMYRAADSALLQVVLGLMLRMGFVLGGFLVLDTVREGFGTRNFTVWLLVFYLAALAVETWCVAGELSSDSSSAAAESGSEMEAN